MSIKIFLEVVEIKTKIASVFPYLIGVLFSLTYFKQFNGLNTLLFFIGMIVFDMATTAINNYNDFVKAKSLEYKFEQNVIGREHLNPKRIRWMIVAMILFTAIIGGVLFYRTGWMLLIMGGIMCLIGIFYTFGPIPLSRMPLGEIFSGVTMGLGIFATTVYLNTVERPVFYLSVLWKQGTFSLVGNFWEVLILVVASLPMVFTIANIMLANNLRDLETDIKNHRYTLVYYIGSPAGIALFRWLMYSCYFVMLFGFLIGIYQWPILITLLTYPKIKQNLNEHREALPHPRSFGYAIKNMVLFNSSYVLGLLLTLIWQKLN